MRIVIALGGNALSPPGPRPDPDEQRRRLERAALAIADLAQANDVVVTHGNGPQVGWLALQAEAAGSEVSLDELDAQSEGLLGYWIEQALAARLPGRDLATLLTQVEVDPEDPAFAKPTKPIGPVYTEDRARALARERAWHVAATPRGWRRVVPSPEPLAICEQRAIEVLVEAGVLVVCAGGGGIPVLRGAGGGRRGVDAVIDKDLTAALLATQLRADVLLLLTDVPGIWRDGPETASELVREISPEALRELDLDPGSMGPKALAACRFAETGGRAAIGVPEAAVVLAGGEAGTQVERTRAPR